MISTKPGSPAFGVLALLVQLPGELDARDLAALLHPEPRHQGPFTPATYRAHVEALREHRHPEAVAARVRRISHLLHGLQQAGLVERCDGVRVAEWFEALAARRGDRKALELARVEGADERGLETHLELVARVRRCPGSVRELRASGWEAECYADLSAWGVLVPPSHRSPTEAGRALVEGAGRAA